MEPQIISAKMAVAAAFVIIGLGGGYLIGNRGPSLGPTMMIGEDVKISVAPSVLVTAKPTESYAPEFKYVTEFMGEYGMYACSKPIQVQRKSVLVHHRGLDPRWETLDVPVDAINISSFCRPSGSWE